MNATVSLANVERSSTTQSERIAAAIAHGGTCVAWFFAPLLVWALERERSRFVEHQAMQALLWSALGTVVSLATCGLAIPLFMVVHVYAAVMVLDGREYEYPLISDLARKLAAR